MGADTVDTIISTVNSGAQTICTPTIVTAAIFLAILVLDMARMDIDQMGGHLVLGLIATLLVSVLCQNASTSVAWIFVALPFVLLVLSWIGLNMKKRLEERNSPYRRVQPSVKPSSPVCCKYKAPCCVNPSELPSA